MAEPLVIWLLSDGKPGHENQTRGLAEAIARLRPCQTDLITLPAGGWWRRLRSLSESLREKPRPDVILGAGHATHLPLLWLAWKFQSRAVVLMKPSLPLSWFDLCLAPEHDFPGGPPSRVVTTKGALNRVPFQPDAQRAGGLLLVGGPSATHGWDGDAVLEQLARIMAAPAPGEWWLTTSRRTPAGMVERLRERLPGVAVFGHEETDREWVPRRLAAAEEVWVTEDSVSMVYEALSSGARVGLLEVPRLQASNRVLRGLQGLVDAGFVTPYATWLHAGCLAPPPHVLREADRCARVLLERFFP
jgi:hypothetical protein